MLKSVAEIILEQRGKDFAEAFNALDSYANFAEQRAMSKDKSVAADARSMHADLGRAMFWFHHGARADGTNGVIWDALKQLAQDFVDRGILKPEAMNRF